MTRIVGPFGGPGGWSEGLRLLGLVDVGIEWDDAACATRLAAGHETIQADVAAYPAERFRGYDGLIMSPPCPDWSQAGRRQGRSGASGGLVDEVPRWVQAIQPRWVACEQVPPVLPVWQDFARLLSTWGYSTWTGILEAERYGVPQTRERAILIASRDGVAHPPMPTHQRYEAGVGQGAAVDCQPSMFGPGVLPWVSMANALGWPPDLEQRPTRGAGMTERHGERPSRQGCEPSFTVTAGTHGSGPRWTLHTNRDQRPDGTRQTVCATRPAPALTAKSGGQWCWKRPATTVCADSRLGAPGHRDREGGERQFAEGSLKLTVEEALVLQSFRPDYPVQGTKTKRFEQIGNAVPPLLAQAIIGALI